MHTKIFKFGKKIGKQYECFVCLRKSKYWPNIEYNLGGKGIISESSKEFEVTRNENKPVNPN